MGQNGNSQKLHAGSGSTWRNEIQSLYVQHGIRRLNTLLRTDKVPFHFQEKYEIASRLRLDNSQRVRPIIAPVVAVVAPFAAGVVDDGRVELDDVLLHAPLVVEKHAAVKAAEALATVVQLVHVFVQVLLPTERFRAHGAVVADVYWRMEVSQMLLHVVALVEHLAAQRALEQLRAVLRQTENWNKSKQINASSSTFL